MIDDDDMVPYDKCWELDGFDTHTEELIADYRLEGIEDDTVRAILKIPDEIHLASGDFPVPDRATLEQFRQYLPADAKLPPGDYCVGKSASYHIKHDPNEKRNYVLKKFDEDYDVILEEYRLIGITLEWIQNNLADPDGGWSVETEEAFNKLRPFLPADAQYGPGEYDIFDVGPPPAKGLMMLKGYKIVGDNLVLHEQYNIHRATIESVAKHYGVDRSAIVPDGFKIETQEQLEPVLDLISLGPDLSSDEYWLEHRPTTEEDFELPDVGQIPNGPTRKEEIERRRQLRESSPKVTSEER